MGFIVPAISAIGSALGGIGGSGFSALGSIVSGGAALATGIYQANVAKANAQIAEQNAKRAVDEGNRAAQEQDNLTRAAIGEQIAVQSASGLSLNSKSSMLTRKAARALGRQDSINARESGDLQAHNYLVDAMNFRNEAKGAMLQGGTGALSGFLQAGSIIGNARPYRKSFGYNPNPIPRPVSLLQ